MVVTNGIERAIQYFQAISDYLQQRKYRNQALVPFSCEHEYGGARMGEASLNGLPSARRSPSGSRMCVDKTLSGIKAVYLVPKLPAPEEEALSKGILDAMDLDRAPGLRSRRCRRSWCGTRTARSAQ